MSSMDKWSKLISFAYASFLVLWLAALVYLLILLHGTGELFFLAREGKPYISDFLNVYAAGKLTLSADRIHIYDGQVQLAMINQLISPNKLDHTFFLQYPPYFFLAMTPLAFFSMAGAYTLWLSVTIAMAVAALFMLVRLIGRLRGKMVWIFLVAVLASSPGWRTLRLGQVSGLLVGTTAFYCYCLLRRKDVGAGIFLALSSIKLQYLPFLAIPLLAGRRWKVMISAAVTELIILGICAAVYGPDNVLNYPKIILSGETSSQYIGVAQEKMVSLIGVVSAVGLKHVSGAISVVGLVAGLALAFVVCRSASFDSPKRAAWPLALTMVIAVLASPHVHTHDLLLLAIAAAMTLQVVSPFDAWKLDGRSRKIWNAMFTLYPVVSWVLLFTQDLCAGVGFFLLNAALLASGLAVWRADNATRAEAEAEAEVTS